MSKIQPGAPVRFKKKTLSSYASFGLFVAAAAIALSAFIVRFGKDRAISTENETFRDPAGNTSSVSASAHEQHGESTAPQTSSTTAQASQLTQKPTTAQTGEKKDDADDDFEDTEQTAAIQVIGSNRSYVRPSGGAAIKPYSMDKLLYSRTMKDWRAHNGLDIAADKGEVVKAAAEGTVAGITTDALYGTTVAVNQNDGLMVYYRGLNKDTAVRQGENIAAGATIGTVGEIPCESADGTHLHIEVMSENKYLDPAEALRIS